MILEGGKSMIQDNRIWFAKNEDNIYLHPHMANRHGLIAGATGTGKTVTLKVLAESFSTMGIPVFLADIKGDLASLAQQGEASPKLMERLAKMGINEYSFEDYPVELWDIFGEEGVPIRTTVSEMGSLMLGRILGLTPAQEGVLNIVFKVADDQGLLLIDLKDLRAMVQYVGDHAKELTLQYGNVSSQSVGGILRSLLTLEDQGGAYFFGEPELCMEDFMRVAASGKGVINILHAEKLYTSPVLYSTFLLWLLSELFETLPEEGDLDQPKMIFFFDEAHLLFQDAPKMLLTKIEQVVRLIRSKGVGVYFVTQSPMDLPGSVLAQLGNRIQHALRAYTPAEIKNVKAAAETFRENPAFSTQKVIMELATGEALISCLDEEGSPSVVQRAMILAPQSSFGTLSEDKRREIIRYSPMERCYRNVVDRESAYEVIRELREGEAAQQEEVAASKAEGGSISSSRTKSTVTKTPSVSKKSSGRKKKSSIEKMADTTMTTIGRELGKSLVRGILGSLKR